MSVQRFTTNLVKAGTRVIIVIPFDPHQVWGDKPCHHIAGSINGYAVRGALDSDGTQHTLSLGAAWRRDSGLAVGDSVNVELAPEGPQVADLAPDVAAALNAAPSARSFFEGLATFYRTGYLRWIDGARRPEARAARIRQMVDLLEAGKKQR